MAGDHDDFTFGGDPELPVDEARVEASEDIEEIFTRNKDKVFFSRQIEDGTLGRFLKWHCKQV